MPRAAVTPTPASPPRYSFLIAAPEAVAVPTWQQGTSWDPEGCGESGRAAALCAGNTSEMTAPDAPSVQSADPFVVYATDKCSPFGFGARDFGGRARRQLLATQSYQVANELWTGSLAEAADPDEERGWLASDDADEMTSSAVSPVQALACLDGALLACSSGRPGMIHVTPSVLTHLVAESAVLRDGQLFRSPMGSIVVADAGYDGSSPDGTPASTTQFAYATDLISYRLTPIELIPGSLDDAQSEAWRDVLDRSDNTVTLYAYRLALYEWDRCCHLAAEVNVPYCEPS